MSLAPGTRLGVYEITAPLGEGGMGQVWRATDTTLGRQVAIKILPDAFASDPERLARFEREAKTLASLNHPNIAQIYGFEKVDVASGFSRTSALVMELVEGEDLSQRIARGAIPLDEALPIAKQIAEALEAAHEQGIIHRDLKPANIKVRPDGTVKVLDFGLAKAVGPSEGDGFSRRQAEAEAPALPTITTPAMTQAGMILGTAAYMSPEQARGKVVDKRADIWAFGVVLFEMLTATRLFAGESVAETLGLIFSREPDLATLPAATPARVRALIARCLVKDPRQRLRDIGEARLALEGASYPFWSPDSRSLAFFASGKLKKIDTAGGAPQVLGDAATARGGAWGADGTIVFAANANSPLVRASAQGGAVTPLTTVDPAQGVIGHTFPNFLPDGRHFLYFQRSNNPAELGGIYVGTLDSSETTRVLATHSTGVYSSGFLWFVQAGSLFAQAFDARALRLAGESIRVADGAGHYPNLGYMSVTVSASGVLVFGPTIAFISSVQSRGRSGAADGAATPAGTYRSPRLSPDQRSVALSISGAGGDSDIWVLDVARGAMSRAVSDPASDWFPVWPPDSRRLFYGSNRGGSTSVFEQTLGGMAEVFAESAQFSGRATYPTDISGDGRFLVFQTGTQRGYDLGVMPLALREPQGHPEQGRGMTGERTTSMFLTTPFNEVQGRFSPNGRWLAYASDESGRFEVYVRPFPAATGQTQVSLTGGVQPEWRRDGRELFYIAADGKLTAVPLTTDGPAFAAGTPHPLFDVEVPEPSAPYQGDYAVTADGQRFFVNTVVDQPTRPALTVILNWRPGEKQ